MLSSPFRLIATVSYDDSDSSGRDQQQASTCLVGTCLNCSYSFRLGLSGNTDFCSKDCQTCYILYSVNPEHTPRKKEKANLKTNKQRVYEFQKQLEAAENNPCNHEDREDLDDMVSAEDLPPSGGKPHPVKISFNSSNRTGK